MTGELFLPANLVQAAALDRHDRRRDWVARLPATVAGLRVRWDLRLGDPFQPGGEGSWTAPARDAAGRDLVLKVGWTHDEGLHEPDALRLYAGRGAVLLRDGWVDGDTSALLMERARPGVELGQSLPEEEQDVVIADLLRRLWIRPPAGHPFRHLARMCAARADEAQDTPSPTLDAGVFRTGVELFRSLPTETRAEEDVLLLTDLHGGNVLSAEREPWLVIDPKPYVGDPAYDPLQHLVNCQERLAADPVAMTGRMADLCGVEPERFRRWVFARWVVESSWSEPAAAAALIQVATVLAP